MANNFPKEVQVAFEEAVEGFDSDNIVANNSDVRQSGDSAAFRSAFTEWHPIEMISSTLNGLDISGSLGSDTIELSVPFKTDQVVNAKSWRFNAKELNDKTLAARKIKAGVTQLSATVNRAVANAILIQGAQTVTKSTALTGYRDIAEIEAMLISQDVDQTKDRTLALNAYDYNDIADNLAGRQTMGDKVSGAYEKSRVGEVAGFDTYKTSFAPTLTAAAGGGSITVNGAQSHTPVASTVDSLGNPTNVDNRTGSLTVSSTANVKPGDKFTIPGVYALSLINKNNTGKLRTFTVVSVVDGTTLGISPQIVVASGGSQAEEDYANCSAVAANGATITWLNTTDAASNVFWQNDSVCLNAGTLDLDDAGLDLMRMRTDSGIELILGKQSSLGQFATDYRLTVFFGTTIKDPLLCGTLLARQA